MWLDGFGSWHSNENEQLATTGQPTQIITLVYASGRIRLDVSNGKGVFFTCFFGIQVLVHR